MLIQIFVIIFAIFVMLRIYSRYSKKEISLREFLFWLFFWIAVVVVTLILRQTDYLAQIIGVERAADLVVYLSLIIIFYIMFRIFVRLDKIERNISKLVTEISLLKKKNEEE